MNSDLQAALQALATQFQVEIQGTIVPVIVPPAETFDVKPQ